MILTIVSISRYDFQTFSSWILLKDLPTKSNNHASDVTFIFFAEYSKKQWISGQKKSRKVVDKK